MPTKGEARITDLAEREIEGLQAEGITPTPAEIVTVQAISQSIATPDKRVALAAGEPLRCGNVTLWPMTMYGFDWLERNISGGDEHRDTLMLAYAMTHPADDLPEGKDAVKAVKEWSKTLKCTYAQIRTAVQCIHDQADFDCTDRKRQPGGGLGELSLTLASLTRTDPAIWERRVCLSYASAWVAEILERARSDNGMPATDRSTRYEVMMGLYLNRIRRRHERENHGA